MKVVDSGAQPTDAQLATAKAAGVGAWLGYRASSSAMNLAYPWPAETFARIKAAGLLTGAYYSGLEDPAWAKADAAALGIPGFLDCESAIRGDGAWTDPWLEATGFRLYGDASVQTVHWTHGHAGYVFAGYPGGAQTATWPSYAPQPNPPRPMGWQYLGTQSTPYGVVDLCNFDAELLGEDGMRLGIFFATVVAGPDAGQTGQFLSNGMTFRWIPPDYKNAQGAAVSPLADITTETGPWFNNGLSVETWPGGPVADVTAFGVPADPNTAAMLGLPYPYPPPSGGGLTAAEAQQLSDLAAAVARIEAALKTA